MGEQFLFRNCIDILFTTGYWTLILPFPARNRPSWHKFLINFHKVLCVAIHVLLAIFCICLIIVCSKIDILKRPLYTFKIGLQISKIVIGLTFIFCTWKGKLNLDTLAQDFDKLVDIAKWKKAVMMLTVGVLPMCLSFIEKFDTYTKLVADPYQSLIDFSGVYIATFWGDYFDKTTVDDLCVGYVYFLFYMGLIVDQFLWWIFSFCEFFLLICAIGIYEVTSKCWKPIQNKECNDYDLFKAHQKMTSRIKTINRTCGPIVVASIAKVFADFCGLVILIANSKWYFQLLISRKLFFDVITLIVAAKAFVMAKKCKLAILLRYNHIGISSLDTGKILEIRSMSNVGLQGDWFTVTHGMIGTLLQNGLTFAIVMLQFTSDGKTTRPPPQN